MVSKVKNNYLCSRCGEVFNKWSGKCPNCGQWNSLIEDLHPPSKRDDQAREIIPEVVSNISVDQSQIKLSSKQINDIFGDGIVRGSVSLIAGHPGSGKTTLCLQLVNYLDPEIKVLFVSAEESIGQVYLKLDRLKITNKNLFLASTTSSDDIAKTILTKKYDLVIVDSIQTVSSYLVGSQTGSVSQITNSASLIINAAKEASSAVIIIGHITKEGFIAGPKVLEHLVDSVFQFEGDKYGNFKILRAIKNRFGSINQVAIFEMTKAGLSIAKNPSEALLKERIFSDGSVVHPTIEGNQAILVEIQALVNKSSFGYPKRATSGFDLNRLNLLIAMLERRTKLKLQDKDIYINIVGGIIIKDPSADLAICMAIASGATAKKIVKDYALFGEVGLSGEIRHVPQIQTRVDEAKKMHFDGVIGPQTNIKDTFYHPQKDLRETLIKYLK